MTFPSRFFLTQKEELALDTPENTKTALRLVHYTWPDCVTRFVTDGAHTWYDGRGREVVSSRGDRIK